MDKFLCRLHFADFADLHFFHKNNLHEIEISQNFKKVNLCKGKCLQNENGWQKCDKHDSGFPYWGKPKNVLILLHLKKSPPLPKTAIIKTLHKVRMLQYLIAKQAFLNISISHQL